MIEQLGMLQKRFVPSFGEIDHIKKCHEGELDPSTCFSRRWGGGISKKFQKFCQSFF